jgi:hypothetical protein
MKVLKRNYFISCGKILSLKENETLKHYFYKLPPTNDNYNMYPMIILEVVDS